MSGPRLPLLALLLLGGCESEQDEGAGPTSGNALIEQLDVTPAAPSAAELDRQARLGLAGAIKDPATAGLADLRAGTAGSLCGTVDSKAANGPARGPRPFVVTPEGAAFVSATPQVMVGDASDAFADFYIRYCVTPEELPLLEAEMKSAVPETLPLPGEAETPPPDLAPLEPAPAPPPPPPAARRPAPPKAGKAGEESFFDAVVRPTEQKGAETPK